MKPIRKNHLKKAAMGLFLFTLSFSVVGCASAKAAEPPVVSRSVRTTTLKQISEPATSHYIGLVDAKNQIEYSFKTSGRLGSIEVKDGDQVKKGQRIAQLDLQDLKLQLNAATSTKTAARLNIAKAKESRDYTTNLHKNMKALYEAGSISQDKLDQVRVKADVAKATYDQAVSQLSIANSDWEHKKSLLEDGSIYAQSDGTVIKARYEVGELIPQGHPVVVQRSEAQVIKVGLPQKQLNTISVGAKCYVNIDGQKAEGLITRIDEAPDTVTRTYPAEITVEGTHYHLGSIAEVDVEIGEKTGLWVPIQALLSEGENFVYIVENNRAFKRTITIKDTSGMLVLVDGLKEGDQVVISGMNNLSDGTEIHLEGEGAAE